MAPQWQRVALGHVSERRQQMLVVVDVVMRVDVGRQPAGQLDESLELPLDLALADGAPSDVGITTCRPTPELRMLGAEARCLRARRRVHHHARAGQDSPPVSLDDAEVDAVARTEVVPVDDQALHRAGSTGATCVEPPDQVDQALAQRSPARRGQPWRRSRRAGSRAARRPPSRRSSSGLPSPEGPMPASRSTARR